jgi:hypothetical protein
MDAEVISPRGRDRMNVSEEVKERVTSLESSTE